MRTFELQTARQWFQLFGLALAAAAVLVAFVAVVLPAVALALALALLVVGALLVTQQMAAVARAARRVVASSPLDEEAAQPRLRLELPDGTVLSARQVPLHGPSEHAMLLTREGYALVDAEGRVAHRIYAEPQA